MVEVTSREMVFLRNVVNLKWDLCCPLAHSPLCLMQACFHRVVKLVQSFFGSSQVTVFSSIILAIDINGHSIELVIPLNFQGEGARHLFPPSHFYVFNFAIPHPKHPVGKSRDNLLALCALCITYWHNLPLKTFFQKASASLNVMDCIVVVLSSL